VVHLREHLSNFSKELEHLVSAQPRHFTNSGATDQVIRPARQVLKQPNRKLQPVEIDELVVDYVAGMCLRALGEKHNLHRQTAKAHLMRRGIELRPQYEPLTDQHRAEIVTRYQAGLSTYRLAKDYGISPDTVQRHLRQSGVQMRDRADWRRRA
jgi:lambda repressor-like predicted transcriptional regulator